MIAALEDYVDGFTLGRPELLERSLSLERVKEDDGRWTIHHVIRRTEPQREVR